MSRPTRFVIRSFLVTPRLSRHERRRAAKCWRWRADAIFDPFESDEHRAVQRHNEDMDESASR